MRVIYETKGRAREFNELAINLFTGCGHRCIYCYGAEVTHTDKEAFEYRPRARVTPADIQRSAIEWKRLHPKENRPILLCFVTDPYQPLEEETRLTRTAIDTLHQFGLRVTMLTKAGERSTRDFDLLTPNDEYATTLTCSNYADSQKWEPIAALPRDRIAALSKAHRLGIPTWVSFEPVIYPHQTYELLDITHPVVGHYKVGTMNYHPHGRTIDWKYFAEMMIYKLEMLKKPYYIKKDLAKYLGKPEGFWGNVS